MHRTCLHAKLGIVPVSLQIHASPKAILEVTGSGAVLGRQRFRAMKAFFGQHADPPSWRSNLLEQTIVLGTCETHSKVYPKLNQLRVFQVRTPPILVKYLAGTNYLP